MKFIFLFVENNENNNFFNEIFINFYLFIELKSVVFIYKIYLCYDILIYYCDFCR